MNETTPRQRRHLKNKKYILEIARKLVINKGHENISLREIARQADFSPAGLYEYFNNKEDLFYHLAAQEAQNLIESLGRVPPGLPIEERLVELCLVYVEHALKNEALFNLMNSMPETRTSLDIPVSDKSPYLIFFDTVQELVEKNDNPLEKSFGIEEITYSLWAQVHGMASLQLSRLKNFQADFKTADRKALETFIRGLLTK